MMEQIAEELTEEEIIEKIREHAGKLTSEKIAELLGMTKSQIMHRASDNKISLRLIAHTVEGENCLKCNTNIRYVKCNHCVKCTRERAKEKFLKTTKPNRQSLIEAREKFKTRQEHIENIAKLVSLGYYQHEISHITGYPSSSIAGTCKRNNIPVKVKRARNKKREWINEWYHDDFDPRPNNKYLTVAWL